MSEKNKGGRPPIFNSVEDLEKKIDEYFNSGGMRTKTLISSNGDAIEVPVPTISGLCIYLGFCSRQSFYDYEENEEFSYTIKRARLFIEREYEEKLSGNNVTGAIFALKNLGWKDKTEIEKYGKDGGAIEVCDVTDRELALRIALALQQGIKSNSNKEEQ